MLCVEVVCGAQNFVVWVMRLEGCEFKGMDTHVVWKRPRKPSMCIVVFDAVTVLSVANR